jgi:hypothetical protein
MFSHALKQCSLPLCLTTVSTCKHVTSQLWYGAVCAETAGTACRRCASARPSLALAQSLAQGEVTWLAAGAQHNTGWQMDHTLALVVKPRPVPIAARVAATG